MIEAIVVVGLIGALGYFVYTRIQSNRIGPFSDGNSGGPRFPDNDNRDR